MQDLEAHVLGQFLDLEKQLPGVLSNSSIKPMLAVSGKAFSSKEWIFEPKIDGARCIAFISVNTVELQNRRLISYYPIAIWTYGKIEIQFQWLQKRPPFDTESKRKELLDRLNQISGFNIPADAITRRPNVFISVLKNGDALKQFLETLDWVVHEIKKT